MEDPLELVDNPLFYSPLQVTLDSTRSKVEAAAQNGNFTWNQGFTISAAGTLTNTYVQGMISGTMTLGMNVGFADGGDGGVELFASGTLNVIGVPLAGTGIV
ncbi:MAG: hypothetical protein SGJ19_26605, partial [Planctomycetia bacterium]|nr:hypothetical protein [Planctomycetia bacterium]